jgi:hypothetical protein
MPIVFTEFEIEIGPPHGDTYPVTARGPGGDARGSLRNPAAAPEFQELHGRLGRLDTDEALLSQIGAALFGALFQGELARVYAASRSRLRDDQALTLRMCIPADLEEIAALPWEFMVDPDIGPLALFDTPIVRYLPQPTPLPEFPIALPLKVLLTGAQTGATAEVVRELEAVEAALRSLGDNVQITVEPHLTADRLSERLLDEVHIWHFVGHGSFDGKAAQLVFEDSQGDADALDAAKLSAMLYRRVRLVVLNACDTGKMATDPFRSLAPALIRAQVPAVIAQQFKVPEEATRAFVTGFYRALARGFPLDACVTEGRKAVMRSSSAGQPDWGIPVVYSRVEDGRLFELPAVQTVAPGPAASGAASAAVAGVPRPASSGVAGAAGPAAPGEPAGAPDATQSDEAATLRAQIEAGRHKLFVLHRRAWAYTSTPPHIAGAIEKHTEELRRLKARLQALRGA